jgi:Ni/Co efflux regulator RcnB
MIGELSTETRPRVAMGQEKEEETTMLKTISAALVAVSVLAAPALAGTAGKTAQAPVNKTTQTPANKAEQGKTKAMNANAKVGRDHKLNRHHRHHKQVGALKTHAKPGAAVKQAAPAAKRG